MTTIWNDVKYGLRMLAKTPGFTVIVVLTLALCIGVNTAMLGVLYRVVLKPLPFKDSEQLVSMGVHHESSDRTESLLFGSEFAALTEAHDLFTHVGGFTEEWPTFSGVGMPRPVWGIRVTSEFLDTLGVSPVIGRAFSPEDYAAGHGDLVLISDNLWHERFGGRTDVLGQSFLLDRRSVTVCGVMPPGFCYPRRYGSYWRPLILKPGGSGEDDERYLNVMARIRPGLSMEQMAQRLQQLSQGYREQQAMSSNGQMSFVGQSLLKARLGGSERILWIFFGAVSCVTLIGSANLIHLYLTRLANIETMEARLSDDTARRRYHATLMGLFAGVALILAIVGIFGVLSCLVAQRRREIGIRMALGSDRFTLFRLILKQGLQPVLIGIGCGWALSWATQNLIRGFLFEISAQDPVTFISVGVLLLITAAAACLLPAYRATKVDPMEALRCE